MLRNSSTLYSGHLPETVSIWYKYTEQFLYGITIPKLAGRTERITEVMKWRHSSVVNGFKSFDGGIRGPSAKFLTPVASLLFAKTAVADETSESEAIAEMPSYMYRTDILYCIVEEVRRANGRVNNRELNPCTLYAVLLRDVCETYCS